MIEPQDDTDASAGSAVAVVSWAYWESRFNLQPTILGKRISVDGFPATIVGVTPPEFFGVQVGYRPHVWLPLSAEAAMHLKGYRVGLRLLGRLKPGISIEHAEAETAVLYRQTLNPETLRDDPLYRRIKFELEPAASGLSHARDLFAQPLRFLFVVMSLLLVIACTNVAGMLLARGTSREREMALRVSLGAGRPRLVRQVLTESLVLSAAGGLLGIFVAYASMAGLLGIMESGRQRVEILVQPDTHVLLFTLGTVVLTGVLFGLVPALRVMTAAPAAALRAAAKTGETRFGRLLGRVLVVAQVALSVLLLSAAALFLSHLSKLRNDLGFQRERILIVAIERESQKPGEGRVPGAYGRLSGAYRALLERLESIPGVRSATLGAFTPISSAGENRLGKVEGYEEQPGQHRWIFINKIAPKFFETLGIPLMAGRDFTFQDAGGPGVGIINEAMARYYFGDSNPIGKHVILDRDPTPFEIVGVVGDTKYSRPDETPPQMYLHAFQNSLGSPQFALRTSIAPAVVAADVRRTLEAELRDARVERITTMVDQVDAAIVPERLIAMLSSLVGGLGLLLAGLGIYGLLAYVVARRTNEIGIRMALGATAANIARQVVANVFSLVAAGLALGIVLAFWGRRLVMQVFVGISVESSTPITISAPVMVAVGLLAAYVPARRAARIEPMEALRDE